MIARAEFSCLAHKHSSWYGHCAGGPRRKASGMFHDALLPCVLRIKNAGEQTFKENSAGLFDNIVMKDMALCSLVACA